MRNKPILSIIIPCFNGENYLKNLFDNLCTQELTDCELIFIDDGSYDNTKEIISSWISTKENAFLYSQKNMGVSWARNLGISKSSGEYVAFLDCDDYYTVDGIKKIKQELQFEDDVFVFGYLKDWGKKTKKLSQSYYDGVYSSEEFLSLFFSRKIKFWIGSFIVRRELLVSNAIEFNTHYRIGEDFDFYYRTIIVSNKNRYKSDIIFGYHIHMNSTTSNYSNYNLDMFNSFIINSKNAEEYFIQTNKLKEESVYFRKYSYFIQFLLYLKSKKIRDYKIESLFEIYSKTLHLSGGLRINIIHSLAFFILRFVPLKFFFGVFKAK